MAMRRIKVLTTLGLASLGLLASSQVWEKRIAPGLTYRMEVDLNIPRHIHALKWSPGANAVKAKAELAGKTVFESNPSFGRSTVSQMVKSTNAIGGINADFFPWTGDPIGLMVRDSEIISLPYLNRSSFGWGGGVVAGIETVTLSMKVAGHSTNLTYFNSDLPENAIGLYTASGGQPKTKGTTASVRLKVNSGEWRIGETISAEVVGPFTTTRINAGECVLVGSGVQAESVRVLKAGQNVEFKFQSNKLELQSITQAVGGGPTLVQKGLIATDSALQGFNAAFSDRRHPRTAVGSTVEGDVWFVVIDGRQAISEGATIDELARVMQRLGCMEAVNLDGGGSSVMNLFGQVQNRPSEGKEREVANGILFYGEAPKTTDLALKVEGVATSKPNTSQQLRIVDDKGNPIPNREVFWSATGSGWVDQGGLLRASAEGSIFVSAWVRGKTVTFGVSVKKA